MRQFTELKKRYPNDPALTYAIDVVTGKVLAGEKMKQACKRHINDLKRIEDDDDFIYVYDVDEAQKIIEFATLLKDVSSKYAGSWGWKGRIFPAPAFLTGGGDLRFFRPGGFCLRFLSEMI